MDGKTLFVLLAIFSIGFATAPSWVANGASLVYSAGSDSITFNVVDVSGGDIKINVIPSSTGKTSKATENASADSGQFWFDSQLLASATVGSTVGDFTVVDESTQAFAGRQWNTITLEDTVSGAKTTRIYDRQSGLMLKQSVDDPKAPIVTLIQLNVPAFSTQPPAQQPTQPPAQENETQPTPQENTSGADTEQPSGATGEQPSQTEQPTQPAAPAGEETKGACASGAVLLAIFGFASFRKY